MIEFVCTPLHVKIALRVSMVTMQFRKAQIFFSETLFSKVGQIRFCGIGYPILVLI